MNPPITVLSPTGHPVHRHVHATGVSGVWTIDDVLFAFAPIASDKSGWCIDGKHRDTCYWKPCGCPCHGEGA